MQEFIRRHFWVVTVAVISVGSFLAAGLMSETLGFVLLGDGRGEEASGAEAATEQAQQPVTVRPRFETQLVSAASERNVFNAEPEILDEAASGDGTEGVPGGGAPANVNIKLLGTLVSDNTEWSLATVLLDERSKLIRVGMLLNEVAEVSEIHERYIVLRQGDKFSVVTLWDVARPNPQANAGQGEPAPGAGGPPAEGGDPYSAGIQKKGPYDYQIDRGMLEEQLQDLTKLGMQARIVPNYEGGRYAGFRLVGIRPNSLYKALGMQSGDLLQRINGEEIDTPNKAIQLFESLRSSSQIAIDVVRRGKKVTMNYTIQ